MNAPIAHRCLTPVVAPQRFAVTLKFTDGVYKAVAITSGRERAIELATIDARMASSFSQHSGKLVSSQAELIPP